MTSLDDLLPTIDAALHARLAALCGEVEAHAARVQTLVTQTLLETRTIFVDWVEIHHMLHRAPDHTFRVDAYDRRPSFEAYSAHQALPLSAALAEIRAAAAAIDGGLLALAGLLQTHAPVFSQGNNAPIFHFSKPLLHGTVGLHLRTHRGRTVEGKRALGQGELLRACVLLCRAKGAGQGDRWTYGNNLMHMGDHRTTVLAQDPASALALIFAAEDHGALDNTNGVLDLVRHEPNTVALMHALRAV